MRVDLSENVHFFAEALDRRRGPWCVPMDTVMRVDVAPGGQRGNFCAPGVKAGWRFCATPRRERERSVRTMRRWVVSSGRRFRGVFRGCSHARCDIYCRIVRRDLDSLKMLKTQQTAAEDSGDWQHAMRKPHMHGASSIAVRRPAGRCSAQGWAVHRWCRRELHACSRLNEEVNHESG